MSIIRFIKKWTLPVSMATGTLLYLIFALIPALDGAATFFAPVFDAILPLFMFLILFVTFCKVDFHKLQPVHWHFWVGVFQVIFVLIIVSFILGFHLQGNSLILMEAILTCIIGPYSKARWQFGGDDHLHLPLQYHHSHHDSYLLPRHRQCGRQHVYVGFPQDSSRGLYRTHRTDVARIYSQTSFSLISSMDYIG